MRHARGAQRSVRVRSWKEPTSVGDKQKRKQLPRRRLATRRRNAGHGAGVIGDRATLSRRFPSAIAPIGNRRSRQSVSRSPVTASPMLNVTRLQFPIPGNAYPQVGIPNLHARPSFAIHAAKPSRRQQTTKPPTGGPKSNASGTEIPKIRFVGRMRIKSTIRLTHQVNNSLRTPTRRGQGDCTPQIILIARKCARAIPGD